MAGFIDSFASAFNPAYQNSLRAWQDQENADRDFGLRKRQADQQAELTGLQIGSQRRIGDAQTALSSAVTDGITRNNGLGLPTEPEYDAGQVTKRPASDRELLGLRKGLAVAQGHDIAPLLAEGKEMDWKEAFKQHIGTFRKMTPEQRHALVKEASEGDAIEGAFSWEAPKGKGGVGRYWHMAPGRAPVSYSESDAEQLFALKQLADTDPARAAQAIDGIKGKARALAMEMLKTTTQAVGTQNQGLHFQAGDEHNARMEGFRSQELGLQKERLDRDKFQILNPQMAFQPGPNGQLIPVITGLRMNQKGGGYEPVVQPLGGSGNGLVPSHALQPEVVMKLAAGLVGKPIPGVQGPDGKPVMYDDNTAYAAAQKQIVSSFAAPQGGASGIDMSLIEAAKKKMLGSPQPQTSGNPAAARSGAQQADARAHGLWPAALY